MKAAEFVFEPIDLHPVAAIVEELAGKESVKVVASARSALGMLGEQAMNSLPGFKIDDRLMNALMDLPLMDQPPDVDRARKDLVEKGSER